jgi:hypothetical protein
MKPACWRSDHQRSVSDQFFSWFAVVARGSPFEPAGDPVDDSCSVMASKEGVGNPGIEWNWTALPALHNVAV